ncbi:MAG: hypothetical protein GYB35_13280 [Algicola sp.]|nr:hypothetical protein [Algicola sp.]
MTIVDLGFMTLIGMLGTLLCIFRKNEVYAVLIAVPLFHSAYFFFSTQVFSFGLFLPYDYFQEEASLEYFYICLAIALHCILVVLALELSRYLLPLKQNESTGKLKFSLKVNSNILFFVSLLPVVFMLLSFDVSLLIDRDTYSFEAAQHGWMRFADLFLLISCFLIPLINNRVLKYTALFLNIAFFSMLGSRSSVLLIWSYVFVDRIILGKDRLFFQVMVGLLGVYWLAIILSLRPGNEGGALSIINKVLEFNIGEVMRYISFGLNYMINYSIVINQKMLAEGVVSVPFYIYSILPIPSSLYDMTEAFDAFSRFRKNVPYPGFLYSIKAISASGYFMLVFLLTLALGVLRQVVSTRRDILEKVLLAAMIILPFLLSLQYNLRTTTRILYVLVLLYFVISLARRFILRVKS